MADARGHQGVTVLTLVVIEAVAILGLGLLVLGLLRSHAEILRRLHDLGAGLDPDATGDVPIRLPGPRPSPRLERPVERGNAVTSTGATAADVTGTSVTDEPVSIGVVGARHDTLLAFLTSGCLTCVGFWDTFRDHRELVVPGGARLVVVAKGPDQESPSRLRELAPDDGPVVRSNEAWEHYRVPVAPYFVYVDGPSGRVIGEGAGQTWKQVTSLLGQALSDAEAAAPANRRLDRETRAERDLADAGIVPGHPSLYPSPPSAPPTRDG